LCATCLSEGRPTESRAVSWNKLEGEPFSRVGRASIAGQYDDQ
jgi:hypothetical protein